MVHGLLALLIWDPNLVSRLEAFVRKSPENKPAYRGMVEAHVTLTKSMPDGTVVVLGDSRMRELDMSQCWSGYVCNLSIGGDTTRGLLSRLPKYERLDRSRLVVLGVGINDLSHFTDEDSLASFKDILHKLEDSGVRRVSVCSVLPVDEKIYSQANSAWLRGHRTSNDRIRLYNAQLRGLCGQFPFSEYVDTTEELADESGNLRPGFTEDGIHLTKTGNATWQAALKKKAQPLPDK